MKFTEGIFTPATVWTYFNFHLLIYINYSYLFKMYLVGMQLTCQSLFLCLPKSISPSTAQWSQPRTWRESFHAWAVWPSHLLIANIFLTQSFLSLLSQKRQYWWQRTSKGRPLGRSLGWRGLCEPGKEVYGFDNVHRDRIFNQNESFLRKNGPMNWKHFNNFEWLFFYPTLYLSLNFSPEKDLAPMTQSPLMSLSMTR